MSLKIKQLRALSDDEVESQYDSATENVEFAIADWRSELDRRAQERAARSADRLARVVVVLSIVSTIIAVAALVVAIVKP